MKKSIGVLLHINAGLRRKKGKFLTFSLLKKITLFMGR
jgi:hypothetical protein